GPEAVDSISQGRHRVGAVGDHQPTLACRQDPRSPCLCAHPGGPPRRDFTTSTSEVGPPSFEWLLGRLGAWGQRRQRLLLALSCLPCVLVGLALGSDALFALTPLYHCGDPNSTKMPDNASCHGPHGQSGEIGVLPILTSNPSWTYNLLIKMDL
uniref:Uncharacterized protein n=1 Tax=Naja naja TaxID=35670 RepID=A0A8C6Y2E9_NAJNA